MSKVLKCQRSSNGKCHLMANFIRCQMFWQLFGTFHSFWHFLVQLLETFAIFWQHSPSLGNFCNLFCNFWYLFHFWEFFWNLFQLFTTFCYCWEKSNRREGRCSVRPTILPFSCIYLCCGSMCFMGSMWALQSYSAVLHLHMWWYY